MAVSNPSNRKICDIPIYTIIPNSPPTNICNQRLSNNNVVDNEVPKVNKESRNEGNTSLNCSFRLKGNTLLALCAYIYTEELIDNHA